MDADRKVYFRAPKGGFPAVPELGWDYIPEGTILKAKKGVYGLNDAPLLWEGAEKSRLCPALFLFRDPTTKKLLGMIGIHVDDDVDPWLETVFRESGGTASEDALLR